MQHLPQPPSAKQSEVLSTTRTLSRRRGPGNSAITKVERLGVTCVSLATLSATTVWGSSPCPTHAVSCVAQTSHAHQPSSVSTIRHIQSCSGLHNCITADAALQRSFESSARRWQQETAELCLCYELHISGELHLAEATADPISLNSI